MPRTWIELAKSFPPPFKDADYDIDLLTLERMNLGWSAGDDYGYQPKDAKGTYINIENGLRITTGVPAKAQNRVWVFGGSTIICTEVPDLYTIPSQIQKLLNENFLASSQVINLGATSLTTKHQLWRLMNNAKGIKKGDIIVFYDGVNDIIQSLYYKNPTGTMINANREQIDQSAYLQKIIFYLYGKYSKHSAFVRRFLYPFDPEERNVNLSVELVTQLKQSYFENIVEASRYAKKKGATFFHFLQPSLYTVSSLTAWEQQLISNGWLFPKELKNIYAVGYPALREAVVDLQNRGVVSFDISDALNGRKHEIFFDFVHVNQNGNELIAQAIVARIWKQ